MQKILFIQLHELFKNPIAMYIADLQRLLILKMQGYLQMWQGFFSRWSKYYFRLHDDTLVFGPSKEQVEGKVHLKVAQIVTTVDDPISFIIHTGTETLRVRASSIEQRVKWFKKMKSIQREVQHANYLREMSSLDQDLGKNNKIKALEQLTVQLWRNHADLQNIIEEIIMRIRGSTAIRSLTDKLRRTVQLIKVKNSEALKIIEEQVMGFSKNRSTGSQKNFFGSEDSEVSQLSIREDNTRYLSFDDQRKKIFKKASKNSSRDISNDPLVLESNTLSRYQSFENRQDHSEVDLYQPLTPLRRQSSLANPIKEQLLETNPVFQRIRKNINNVPFRSILPEKFTPQQKFPLLSVLTGAGSDLTRFAFPVTLNQPISFLQKGCQQMYYSKLLDDADNQEDPARRMLYVTAFVVSQYSLTDLRTKKPFNPLLGETFEFIDEERDFQYISEQVSHHPPISAIHCRSNHFQLLDNSKNKTSFSGTSLKFIPDSKGRIILQKFKDEYIFSKCTMNLNNVVMGKLFIQMNGEISITCKKFNTKATLKFRQQTFWKKELLHHVEGDVAVNDQSLYSLRGKWNQNLVATDVKQKKLITLWERRHVSNPQYYYFNEYTMLLNHLNKANFDTIAPTDSRLRPDQRALEFQDLGLAESQKLRLEEKQRATRKENEEQRKNHEVLWFTRERDQEGQQFYVSNDLYWQQKRRGSWLRCLNIF